jgi:hypothetical protein
MIHTSSPTQTSPQHLLTPTHQGFFITTTEYNLLDVQEGGYFGGNIYALDKFSLSKGISQFGLLMLEPWSSPLLALDVQMFSCPVFLSSSGL